MPPAEFLKKAKETQKQGIMEFFSTLLNQNLHSNYRTKAPCYCTSFKLNRNQEEQYAPPTNMKNNTLTSVRMIVTYKRPRQQQKQKKVEMKSEWSTDSDNRRDN